MRTMTRCFGLFFGFCLLLYPTEPSPLSIYRLLNSFRNCQFSLFFVTSYFAGRSQCCMSLCSTNMFRLPRVSYADLAGLYLEIWTFPFFPENIGSYYRIPRYYLRVCNKARNWECNERNELESNDHITNFANHHHDSNFGAWTQADHGLISAHEPRTLLPEASSNSGCVLLLLGTKKRGRLVGPPFLGDIGPGRVVLSARAVFLLRTSVETRDKRGERARQEWSDCWSDFTHLANFTYAVSFLPRWGVSV